MKLTKPGEPRSFAALPQCYGDSGEGPGGQMKVGWRWRDRLFWDTHSSIWDCGAADEVRTRRARRKGQGLSRSPMFRLADLNEPLPFRNESFDCVLCANVVQCVEQPALLLQEARRVLVHGGWLALVGKVPGTLPSSPPPAAVRARLFAPVKRWASRWARHLPEAVLLQLVERAGFLDATCRSADDRVEVSGRAP